MHTAANLVFYEHTKYIVIDCHFVCDAILARIIKLITDVCSIVHSYCKRSIFCCKQWNCYEVSTNFIMLLIERCKFIFVAVFAMNQFLFKFAVLMRQYFAANLLYNYDVCLQFLIVVNHCYIKCITNTIATCCY